MRGWNGLYDGGRVGRDVLQVLCTLLSKTDQTKTMQTKDLAILTYFDLETRNMINKSLLEANHAR